MTTQSELMTPVTLDRQTIQVGDNPEAEARLRLLIGATNSHLACFTEVQNNGSTSITNTSTLSSNSDSVAERCSSESLLALIEKWRAEVASGSVTQDSLKADRVDLSTNILARFCGEQHIAFPFPKPANVSPDEESPQQPAPATSEDSHRPAQVSHEPA